MYLIADSGSTKTDWCLCNQGTVLLNTQTQGINPYHQTEEAIEEVLRDELLPQLKSQELIAHSSQLHIIFYGSGCANATACNRIKEALYKVLGTETVTVHSDLLGAARALCGHEEGIACVLGTGSNSCLYNGKEIVAKDNEVSLLRTTKPAKAYFNCHTDITIPYKELALIEVLCEDGRVVEIIRDGRFVLPGTEELNRPFQE